MPFAEQVVTTLVEPQPALLDFNHDPRYPGEHFTCCPHLVLEHHRRGNRPGKVKVTTLLQVTRLLRGRVRIQRKTAQGHHPSSQSQTAPPTQGSTGSSERRVSRQPTQFLSILPVRMTEKSATRRHSYRQNKG